MGQGGSPGIPGGIFGGTTTLNLSNANIEQNPPPTKRNAFRLLWNGIKSILMKRQTYASIPGQQTANFVAVGVELATDSQSSRQTISATREVIVAAGALHSPQLLMLSGIGPVTDLQALNIPVNVDLPGVGSNLQE